jgi:hypothetical protein
VGVWAQGTVRKEGTGGWRKLYKEFFMMTPCILEDKRNKQQEQGIRKGH